ncbi:S8 family serine peptidase [Alkalimonas amylolytica]|uniref:Peptidase inhibitor I9 n=1 Tax=Alkalimonas amylolytica TaxID=152573 RepID=A0A1H4C9D6_ALKAM|nr:S8 family serine peptidase [Alkalimonas amylolytica]SEA57021.1 Peptidase inhibitor I9 [Alkalimonas amylolytica]
MKIQTKRTKTILASAIMAACAMTVVHANPYEVSVDTALLQLDGAAAAYAPYIIQVRGESGIEKAARLGELRPNSQLTAGMNRYDARSAAMQAHQQQVTNFHQNLAAQMGISNVLYSYTHTFNGFSATLTADEVQRLRQHPDVVGVWQDEPMQLDTSNTPEFLGLNGANGQHTLGVKGENVVIGIVDTGIWPESESFADDGSYAPLDNWNGVCDTGEDDTFFCNGKMVGARYFNSAFTSVYNLQPGEFVSPRDPDNHGTHVASTAAGNEGVMATINGQPAGFVTGVAPRARIATYKACWNSSYVSPEGNPERGCFFGDTMAAIDAAVADGVDVINYSIGGSLTDLTTLAAAAKLRATQAGVFVSVSAGNSGPGAGTVGTPAPWVMSVAASTYDGTSVVVGGAAIDVTGGSVTGNYPAVEAATTTPLFQVGEVAADLAVASPILACDGVDNAAELEGKIVLMQRGVCPFDNKLAAAQAAGAVGAIVLNSDNTAPFVMGGNGSFSIPGFMISRAHGLALLEASEAGEDIAVRFVAGALVPQTEVGNIMAGFSSRGPNLASFDIIKPDITAPGVRILAAGSEERMLGANDVPFVYLQGTSMSSPHIAGMAALLKESNPNWSPAMIKSALMTTARQNVVKQNGVTAADPFDFGAGHAVPASAANPGLVYNVDTTHYFAFLCGLGAQSFVSNASGFSCDAFANMGYDFEASQLNMPSIGIAELDVSRVVYREVTDVSGFSTTYTIQIDAPAGIQATALTLNALGEWVPSSQLEVPANGQAAYAIKFETTSSTDYETWKFGSVTLSNGQFDVRSPIAIKAIPPTLIEAPEVISAQVAASSGRVSFPVLMNYSGRTSASMVGLSAPFASSRTIPQDPDGTFQFNEPSLGTHILEIPAGTKVARFMLNEGLATVPGAILDLYVYRCQGWSCSFVTSSTSNSGFEDIVLRDPVPAANQAAGNVYIVWVHPRNLQGAAEVTYTMPFWIVDQHNNATSRLAAPVRAIDGRFNNVTLMTRDLQSSPLPYMGVISFADESGNEQASTLIEIRAN